MQETKTATKPPWLSQGAGKIVQGQPKGSGQNGSPKRGGDDTAIPGAGLHAIAGQLKCITRFEADFHGESIESNRGIGSMINSEEKQLQAIEDLYKIVRAQPKYKKLKEPSWDADTRPLNILTWLLKKLGPLAKGNDWTADTWYDGKKTRFQFVVYKGYSSYRLKHREEFMALDFLPILKEKDPTLHDLVVDTVALVSRVNKIPLWSEDGDYSRWLKPFTDAPPTTNQFLEEQRSSYRNGPAAQYLQLLKRRRQNVTAEEIKSKLARYDPSSQRKKEFIWWVKKGLYLAYIGGNIKDHSFVPGYMKQGLTHPPFGLYKFIWSDKGDDALERQVRKDMRSREQVYPVMFTITRPGQKVKPIEYSEYPEQLYYFLSQGIKHVFWRYKDYYGASRRKGKKSTTLIEIIEREEIRVTV